MANFSGRRICNSLFTDLPRHLGRDESEVYGLRLLVSVLGSKLIWGNATEAAVWTEAEQMEMVPDVYERTGDLQQLTLFRNFLSGFVVERYDLEKTPQTLKIGLHERLSL